MYNSLLYSTARISSVSKNMLTQDKIQKLVEADELSAAVKILYECGYGGGLTLNNPLEYDKLLAAEEDKLNAYIFEILPEGYGFESLFYINDYHNAKVVAKSKYGNASVNNSALLSAYKIPIEQLENFVFLGEFDKLPSKMESAFEIIDAAFTAGKGTPSLIDVELDRALYLAIFDNLKHNRKARAIREYFTEKVDLTNIINFFRCRKIGFDFKEYAFRFMPTGSFDVSALERAYTEDDSRLNDLFKNTEYADFLQVCYMDKEKGSFVNAETLLEDRLLVKLRTYKYDVFSIGCIVNYYFGKKAEIKEIKIILTGIKNGVKPEEIKKRLRELYA